MFKNYRKILLFLVAITILASFAHPALALEATYPSIPGIGSLNPTSNLPGSNDISLGKYINYIFYFLLAIIGLATFASLTWSGFQIILYAENPSKKSEAINEIWNCALGIALLLTSFIILRTINPDLVSESTNDQPYGYKPGLYYLSDPGLDFTVDASINPGQYLIDPAPPARADLSDTEGITIGSPVAENNTFGYENAKLWYNCIPANGTGKKLVITLYNQPNYQFDRTANGSSSVNTFTLDCSGQPPGSPGNSVEIGASTGVKSFKYRYESPGVYFYLNSDCTGVRVGPIISNQAIPRFDSSGNDQQARCMKILSASDRAERYGAVLTQGSAAIAGQSGQCSVPVVQIQPGWSAPVQISNDNSGTPTPPLYVTTPFQPAAVWILKLDPTPNTNDGGVTFESTYRRRTINMGNIGYLQSGNFNNNLLSGSPIGWSQLTPAEETAQAQAECPTAQNTPSCIDKISFTPYNYYVVLYAKNSQNANDMQCEVYTTPVTDFSNEKIFRGGRLLYQTWIGPSADFAILPN